VLSLREASSFNVIYVVINVMEIMKRHCLLEHIFYLFVTDHTHMLIHFYGHKARDDTECQ